MQALTSIPWLGLTHSSTRIGLLIAGLCLGALRSGSAHAQDNAPPAVSERDIQARRLFEQGREAYSDGRYRDAWAYFHEAYQLSGRPELLFNIGQTADRLGQASDALTAFSMYLERLPAAPNRKDVENRVRALRDRLAASQQAQNQAPPSAAAATRPAQAERREGSSAATAAAPRQPLPTPPTIAKPAKEPRRGFILRAAIGLGPRSDTISRTTQSTLLDPTTVEYSASGWGLALDLGVGWGVLPGFAVGGGLFLDWAASPTLKQDGGGETELASARLTTVGPFVDWYPVRKTLGWYILGSFGLAVLSYKNTANNPNGIDGDAYGFGVTLGTGYEFNLSTSIGLGVELRFLTAVLGEAVSDQTTSHVLTSPSLLASFTWF